MAGCGAALAASTRATGAERAATNTGHLRTPCFCSPIDNSAVPGLAVGRFLPCCTRASPGVPCALTSQSPHQISIGVCQALPEQISRAPFGPILSPLPPLRAVGVSSTRPLVLAAFGHGDSVPLRSGSDAGDDCGEARTLQWPWYAAELPLLRGISMSPGDDTPPYQSHDSLEQLQHDLKTPLTTIHGRAQLLIRAVRRSPTLADEERTRMLEGLASIETAVLTLTAMIDALDSSA